MSVFRVHPLPTMGSAIRPRFYYGDPIPLSLLVVVAIAVVDSINRAVGVLEGLELTPYTWWCHGCFSWQHLLTTSISSIDGWMRQTDRQSYKQLEFIYPSIHTILCHRSNDRIDGWMDCRPTTTSASLLLKRCLCLCGRGRGIRQGWCCTSLTARVGR